MRDWDLEVYSALLKRPSLCMGSNDWNKVEEFIRAYELGSKWECNFMDLLTNQIKDNYGVSMPTRGLIAQMKIASLNVGMNWESFFVEEAQSVLIKASDEDHDYRFRRILRNKILKYFQEVPELIDCSYFINLNQINRQAEDWHGENLSPEEIELLKGVLEELRREISNHEIEKFVPSKNLKLLVSNLKKLVEKEIKS